MYVVDDEVFFEKFWVTNDDTESLNSLIHLL